MFLHGYNSYIRYAFPHDELKPLSRTYTDSLAQLGNSNKPTSASYHGVALTLIDSLSTLAVLGERDEFIAAIDRVRRHVHFEQSVRVNVFEVNIRLLGGLLSGHVLAADRRLNLTDKYDGVLLERARELGDRLMPAFRTPTGMPYAWVNLATGVEAGETTEQCSAGVGTLLLEFGLLSYLTRNDSYFQAADKALTRLYSLRSPLQLVGNTVDISTSRWLNGNAGIGAGVDSYFEYMYKAHVLLGNSRYWSMFNTSYTAAITHLKLGSWYIEADMNTGQPQHLQFQSLHSFWPGLQSLLGHFDMAADTFTAFFSLWTRYNALPERFVLNAQQLHNSERYYPLRPELMESAYYLYRLSRHPRYLVAGEFMYHSLYNVSRVGGGYAGVKDVESRLLEDHMSSFFLAETCKYLYLLFDEDNWLHHYEQRRQAQVGKRKGRGDVAGGSGGEDVIDYMFTTEGHLFPLLTGLHERYGDSGTAASSPSSTATHDASAALCPVLSYLRPPYHNDWMDAVMSYQSSLNQPTSSADQQQCPPAPHLPKPAQPIPQPAISLSSLPPGFTLPPGLSFPQLQIRTTPPPLLASTGQPNVDYLVRVADGAFYLLKQSTGERVEVRNLGTRAIEVMWSMGDAVETRVMTSRGVFGYEVRVQGCGGGEEGGEKEWRMEAAGAFFSPSMPPGVQYAPAPSMLQDLLAQATSGAGINLGNIPGLASLFPSASQPASSLSPSQPFAVGVPLVQIDTPVEVPTESLELPFTPLVRSSTPLGCAVADEMCIDPSSPDAMYWYSGSVVLVDRGDCSFLDKAALAEDEDAVAVLVVNQPPSSTETAGTNEMSSDLFAMGFDGNDREVSIPALMISWRDGQRLYECLDRQDEEIERLLHDQSRAANDTVDSQSIVDGAGVTRSELSDEAVVILEDQCLAVDEGGVHVSMHRFEDVLPAAGVRAGGADDSMRPANLRVKGSLSHLFVELSSGWTVEVMESGSKQYQLRIH